MNLFLQKRTVTAPHLKTGVFLTGVLLLFFGCQGGSGEREYRRALKEWQAGKPVRARAAMEKAIRKRAGDERNAEAYNQLGLILWELNEPQKALEAFSASREISADRFDATCNLGQAFLRQNNVKAAQSLLTEASLMRPLDARPLEWLGQALLKQGRWQEAAKTLTNALARDPDSPQIKTALALARFNVGGPVDPSIRTLNEVVQSHPGYAPALFNLAVISRHTGQSESALEYQKAFIAAAPEAHAARRMLESGVAALRTTPASNALKFTRPARPARAAADEAFTQAFRHYAAGEYEQAFKHYIRAIEADDTYETAFYNLALTCYALEKLPEAKAACLETLALNPGNENARYMLALVYYKLHETGPAETHVQTVLQHHPDHAQAVNLLNLLRHNQP